MGEEKPPHFQWLIDQLTAHSGSARGEQQLESDWMRPAYPSDGFLQK